jgi:hypothetical protein
MPFKLEDLMPSYKRFFESFLAVKICPRRIKASEEILSFNTLTLAISVVIFILARSTAGPENDDLQPQIIATVISAFIAFVSGYVTLIFKPNREGMALAKKWGIFFVHVWIGSLIALIVLDGIAVWTGNINGRISSFLIDSIFVPGYLSAWQKDLLRALLFTSIALGVLLIKTARQDPDFTFVDRCWFFAVALGLIMNSFLLLWFVYGNFV